MTAVNITQVVKTVTVVQGTKRILRITVPGPQGPAGGIAYVHTQAAPSTTWVINHNLGYRPAVELLDTGSQEIDAEIAHPSVNQTIVTLNPATAGLARLT